MWGVQVTESEHKIRIHFQDISLHYFEPRINTKT
jgi:hypothetical protein